MKKKILTIIFFLFLLLFGACNKEKEENQENEDIKSIMKEYLNDYEIVQESEDKYNVTISAPDFAEIIANNIENDIDKAVEVDMKTVINNATNNMKEYTFTCTSTEQSEIEKAYFQEIARDIMSYAVSNVKIIDEWGTEE